jgi:hypothetical protein
VPLPEPRSHPVRVINIEGSSDEQCSCGSWLDHWEKFSGQSLPLTCAEMRCTKKPTKGAHVQKSGSNSWYIAPLCDDHNSLRGQSLEMKFSVRLAPANKSVTCDKLEHA